MATATRPKKVKPAITVTKPQSVKKNKFPEGVTRGRESILVPFDKIEIEPNFNKRIVYEAIPELSESIRINGLKNALVVKRTANGTYLLRSGHRRYKALQMLIEAGVQIGKIPCETQGKNISGDQEIVGKRVPCRAVEGNACRPHRGDRLGARAVVVL